ncbi:MAG: LPS assembly protein LptD [Pseudomonadota bacterium]|nr:LPS assembly protein LptD [Pseudomonadota bacterium]
MNLLRSIHTLTLAAGISAGAFATSHAAVTPYLFDSEDISFNAKTGVVTAEGNVKITAEQGSVWADRMTYDSATGITTAEGNVTLVDSNKTALFFDKIELSDDFNFIVLDSIKARLGEDGPVFAAMQATRENGTTYRLSDLAYTPCKLCDEHNPVWQIRAGEVKYDAQEQMMSYSKMYFDVYGTPVFYLPYMTHSVNNKPISGMLPPTFGSSSVTGQEITLSYYQRFAENFDATIRNRYMTERGNMLIGQTRYIGRKVHAIVDGSIISDTNTSEVRSHAEVKAVYRPRQGMRVGVNGTLISDDSYLDEFFGRTPNFAPFTGFVEQGTEDTYAAIYGRYYHDLRDGIAPETTPQVAPRLIFEHVMDAPKSIGGEFKFNVDGVSLSRELGYSHDRLATQASYSKPFTSKYGDQFTLGANVRADYYNIDTANSAQDGAESRVHGQATLDWSRPYVNASSGHIITPRIKLMLSPVGNNPNEINNEDGTGFELDSSNLFSDDRFAGYDVIESGSRVVYGVDNKWGTPDKIGIRTFFGQSIRFDKHHETTTTGGTETQTSDWVALAEIDPTRYLSARTDMRLDHGTFEIRRIDSNLRLGALGNNYISVRHSLLDGGEHEVSGNAYYQLADNWGLEWAFNRDMNDGGKLLKNDIGLVYQHNCFNATFSVNRRGYNNRSAPAATEFTFNVELLTLGRDSKVDVDQLF